MTATAAGVDFPADAAGARGTTTTARAVVAQALRAADPVGARAAEHETAWRSGYLQHFRRLVEAGLGSPEEWRAIAAAGLAAIDERMVVVDGTGAAESGAGRTGAGENSQEAPATDLLRRPARRRLTSVEITGTAEPATELLLPYRGGQLSGDALREKLAAWCTAGVIEPSVADAIGDVIDHPEWLRLDGHTVVVLGAGAEMGPVAPLLGWGARVAPVDLPAPALWNRLIATARTSAGTLLVPTEPAGDPAARADDGRIAATAGADLLTSVPDLAEWLLTLDGRLVVGNYLYADGGTHVRLSVAADLLMRRLSTARPDTALAFLATPTDVFAVPRAAVEQSAETYRTRSGTAKVFGRPLRWVTRGRLLHRAYPPDADPGIADALVPAQGPNYALAKRIQRWRATVAAGEGRTVAFHVAPSTRTRSVVKNHALAAAFAGARRFGIEVFDPATANTLMAALLVADLAGGVQPHPHPWQDEAHAAVHGGLWRAAYAPRSVLGLAAVLGYAASRR